MSAWESLFGDSETALRAPSAIAFALTLPVLFLTGRRLFGAPTGLLGAVLFALNPFDVQYAQMARGYAIVTLLVTTATWLFIRLLDRPNRATAVGYVVLCSVAFYIQVFSIFVVAAHAVSLIVIERRGALRQRWLVIAVGIALLCTPMLWFAVHTGSGDTRWIPQTTGRIVLDALIRQSGGTERTLEVMLIACAFAIGLRGARQSRANAITFSWLLVPYLLVIALSLVLPFFQPHYVIAFVPALMLVAASVVRSAKTSYVRLCWAIALVAVLLRPLMWYYQSPAWEDWRGAIASIRGRAQPGDGIVLQPESNRWPVG